MLSEEILIGLSFIVVTTVSGEKCDNLGTFFYEDLGCTPVYGESKSCPIKYSCTGLDGYDNKCEFKGKTYEDGEYAEDSLSAPSCDKECFCSVQSGKGKFVCAILNCEWSEEELREGCYRKYSLDECCSTGQVCPPFDNNTTKCVLDGKEYREGEKFFPKNTCLECVCKKEFTGKLEEPFCRKRLCGSQFRRRAYEIRERCAPLYENDSDVLCCPQGRICSDGTEKIIDKRDECKFGDKTLKVGQGFEKSNVENNYGQKFSKISCECVIPPLVTCKVK